MEVTWLCHTPPPHLIPFLTHPLHLLAAQIWHYQRWKTSAQLLQVGWGEVGWGPGVERVGLTALLSLPVQILRSPVALRALWSRSHR